MGFLNFFSGRSPEACEQKGDGYFDSGEFGLAKMEYETALEKLEKKAAADPADARRLQQKCRQARENLAHEHDTNATRLMAADCHQDAAELLALAMELTADTEFKARLAQRLKAAEQGVDATADEDPDQPRIPLQAAVQTWVPDSEESYFEALVASLPEPEQAAYAGYGEAFKSGYVALNQGRFEDAVEKLSQATMAHPADAGYIPLELATAQLNCDNPAAALSLLQAFVKAHPSSVKAYALMCEIFWERKDFDAARQLLGTCPETVSDSVPGWILLGETLFLAGDHGSAASHYRAFIDTHGWHPDIAQALAGVYQAMGENKAARDLYGKIMGECQGCGRRIDPVVKRRYAEACLAAGDHSVKTLELFLALTREDPAHLAEDYRTISRIYAQQGNQAEARRFAAFASQARNQERP